MHKTSRAMFIAALAGFVVMWTSIVHSHNMPKRSYEIYEPRIKQHTIYGGQYDGNHFAYNHCASLEWFNGQFYCVWNAHTEPAESTPGQPIVLSTSKDFINWSKPVNFVGPGYAENPVDIKESDPKGKSWQPCLMNYKGKELWCVWFHSGKPEYNGLYLSKLKKGEHKWVNTRIFNKALVDTEVTHAFTAQNPVLLKSGRVLFPVTFLSGAWLPDKQRPFYCAILYSDDAGHTWSSSNVFGLPDCIGANWEPCVLEQHDEKLRIFARNMSFMNPRPTERMLTLVGTGTQKGQPVVIQRDAQFCHIETISHRMQVLKLTSGRFCMFHSDIYSRNRSYQSRKNEAIFFSRTGKDDFIAGPRFSKFDQTSTYPQGIEYDGKIYVAYTKGDPYPSKPKHQPRSIEGAVIDPAPSAKKFYIFPRDKDYLIERATSSDPEHRTAVRSNTNYEYTRPHLVDNEGRKAIQFEKRGVAGVETDPVDFGKAESLTLEFDLKVLKTQDYGNLIVCSFGDKYPIRLGMPAARVGRLYAQTANGWQDAGRLPLGKWETISVIFTRGSFTVKVADQEAKHLGIRY